MNAEVLAHCIDVFNSNPLKGVQELFRTELIREDYPEDLIDFLHNEKLDRPAIGKFLASPTGIEYRKGFIEYKNVEELQFLDAIRLFYSSMIFPGEIQIHAKLLEFVEHYMKTSRKTSRNISFK